MIRFLFSFSGRTGQGPYALMTLVFFALVLIAAWSFQGAAFAPFTIIDGRPWQTLGEALDAIIRIPNGPLDFAVSLTVGVALLWPYMALTVRRLRDIGQSPWWSLLVAAGGLTSLAMMVLCLIPSAMPRPAAATEAAAAAA